MTVLHFRPRTTAPAQSFAPGSAGSEMTTTYTSPARMARSCTYLWISLCLFPWMHMLDALTQADLAERAELRRQNSP